jgi:hypothetical protein
METRLDATTAPLIPPGARLITCPRETISVPGCATSGVVLERVVPPPPVPAPPVPAPLLVVAPVSEPPVLVALVPEPLVLGAPVPEPPVAPVAPVPALPELEPLVSPVFEEEDEQLAAARMPIPQMTVYVDASRFMSHTILLEGPGPRASVRCALASRSDSFCHRARPWARR